MNRTLSHKTWVIIFASTILLFATIIAGINIYYDFYSIFGYKFSSKEPINSNQRFNKIAYLDNHIGEFNGFLIGSSRMGNFPVEYIEEKSGGNTKFYNLNIFSGVPEDYLKILKYLKKTGHPIQEVIIGIDSFPLFSPPDLSRPSFRHHPNITGKNQFEFMLDYLFQSSFVYLLTEADYYFGTLPIIYSHDYTTGQYYPLRTIFTLENNSNSYWNDQIKKGQFKIDTFQKSDHTIHIKQQQDLLQLINWLKQQSFSYKIFIQPTHPLEKDLYSKKETLLLEELFKSIPGNSFIKIDNIDNLLSSNRNFYDLMHYKPIIAKAVIDRLF